MAHLLYRCYAKLNLSLEILGRRDDGFHELSSVVHTISLADDLRIELANELVTRVEGLDIEPETNLVWRAAQLLMAATGERRGAQLTLVKRVPAAAGLGGGSSNAATTLVGLNRLWQSGQSLAALQALSAQLGSDVPFFVRGGAALMQGRGEELTPLPPWHAQWLALVVPPHDIGDKTRGLYRALNHSDFSSGDVSERLAERAQRGEALHEEDLVNGFSRAACEIFPGLKPTWQELEQRAGRRFFLSGAGPALFALASDRRDALRMAHASGLPAFAVRTVKHARASIRVALP